MFVTIKRAPKAKPVKNGGSKMTVFDASIPIYIVHVKASPRKANFYYMYDREAFIGLFHNLRFERNKKIHTQKNHHDARLTILKVPSTYTYTNQE